MDYLQQSFRVTFEYKVVFTEHLFQSTNPVLRQFFRQQPSDSKRKLLFVVDEGVLKSHTYLPDQIKDYFKEEPLLEVVSQLIVVPGGEEVKNSEKYFYQIVDAVNEYGIDRHSYLIAIGGGSVLDLAGYAAAVSHRGIKHIRIPTTVLSQNDSGVGVKNGINFFGKKNFLGTFAPPAAVFNDTHFLTTLSDVDWRSGISEAIKVALIKDAAFFQWLEKNAALMAQRDMPAMLYQIRRCAERHLQHIASADPFETGSSRPLDFGHWSAHKLEQLTNFSIRHGEAVAYGIALDSAYSYFSGRLQKDALERIIALLKALRFSTSHPFLEVKDEISPIVKGLNEFREHLGGKLTIMLLRDIGKGEEVHEIELHYLQQASQWLKENS